MAGLPAAVRDKVMVATLRNLPALTAEDPMIAYYLRTSAWVPTASGELRMPLALLDPR